MTLPPMATPTGGPSVNAKAPLATASPRTLAWSSGKRSRSMANTIVSTPARPVPWISRATMKTATRRSGDAVRSGVRPSRGRYSHSDAAHHVYVIQRIADEVYRGGVGVALTSRGWAGRRGSSRRRCSRRRTPAPAAVLARRGGWCHFPRPTLVYSTMETFYRTNKWPCEAAALGAASGVARFCGRP